MPFVWKSTPELPPIAPPEVIPDTAVSSEVNRVANTVNIGGTLSYNTSANGYDVVYQVPALNVVFMNITTGSVTTNANSNLSITNIQFVLSSIANAIANIPAPSGGSGGITQVVRGLRMSTDPDQNPNVLLSKVKLAHADEMVMNDGAVANTGWINLIADIDANGANGLSTGTKANNTWYEIHAIRKKVLGTQGLILHKLNNYSVNYTAAELATWFGGDIEGYPLRGSTPFWDAGVVATKLASSFSISANGDLTSVDAFISSEDANVSGSYWFTIEADTSGHPSGTPLATSRTYTANRVPVIGYADGGAYILRALFDTPAALLKSTIYWLVLQADYTPSDTLFLHWGFGNGVQPANVVTKIFKTSTSTWVPSSTTNAKLMFNIWTRPTPQVALSSVMPTGYDQSCLLGYVFYNKENSSNTGLSYFTQQNRTIWYGLNGNEKYIMTNDGGLGIGSVMIDGLIYFIPTEMDLHLMVPPIPSLVTFHVEELRGTGDPMILSASDCVDAIAPFLGGTITSRIAGSIIFTLPALGFAEATVPVEQSMVLQTGYSSQDKLRVSKLEF